MDDKTTIYWHLPGLCYHGLLNQVLFQTMKEYPYMFREGYKIGSVYGTFPCAIWNGGRNFLNGFSRKKDVEDVIESYNKFDIPARFTWTNTLLEEKHIYDSYCNMIMEVGDNGMNQVLVNSPILEDYIRKTYPSYKILSSTTKRILNVDNLIEELNKDYFLVVLDYDFNHDEKVIEKIQPYADKIEILVNETCMPHCPKRVMHYNEISKYQLAFDGGRCQFMCADTNRDKGTFNSCKKLSTFMSNTDVEEYAKKGFVNFKIVGRGETKEFYIDSLVYYLVKPEYQDKVRKQLMDTLVKLRGPQQTLRR